MQKFDDSIDQFIKILKKTTSAYRINLYTKELVQIYIDYEDQEEVKNLPQLKKFRSEVFKDDAKLSRKGDLKKYSIPETSCFKNIKYD